MFHVKHCVNISRGFVLICGKRSALPRFKNFEIEASKIKSVETFRAPRLLKQEKNREAFRGLREYRV